jgi:tRNA (cytidine/uridine-2'-O-)-methyltransferase
MRLALYQPDIPQNAGTILRTAACLGVAVDIIEPCGFLFDDRHLRRAGMDYMAGAEVTRHGSWKAFRRQARDGRLVLLSAHAKAPYNRFGFREDDTLLLGRESAGFPEAVWQAAEEAVTIPMRAGMRSLNVAVAAAMVLGEALRQTDLFPAGT